MRKLDDFPRHYLFLQWLLFMATLVFVMWLAWDYGFLALVFQNDPTRISVIIGLIFLGGTVHCALRVWYLSNQLNEAALISSKGKRVSIKLENNLLLFNGKEITESLVSRFLLDMLRKNRQSLNESEQQTTSELMDVLAEQASGQHETGWFFANLLIKLGLLGTVVGFVLMLTSVADISSIEFADLQEVIAKMAVGMGVALTTTLVGLVGSMLLGFQYLMLDRAADRLISMAVHFANVHLYNDGEGITLNGDRSAAT